MVDVSNVDAS